MTISIIILCILYIIDRMSFARLRRPVSPFQNAVICRGIVVDTLQTKADVGHAPYLLTYYRKLYGLLGAGGAIRPEII